MSDNESSGGEFDEEEIKRNFDREASLIVQNDTLPKKSSDRYLLVYNTYKDWKKENCKLLSSSEENNLIVYFTELKSKLKPPTLWSIWSTLKKTLGTRDDINLENFLSLKSIIKANFKSYKPKKSALLRWEHITKFMDTAPDFDYLSLKVVLIFGVCGALRSDEIRNMQVNDVEDLGNKFIVSINENKNDYPGRFMIGELFYKYKANQVNPMISVSSSCNPAVPSRSRDQTSNLNPVDNSNTNSNDIDGLYMDLNWADFSEEFQLHENQVFMLLTTWS
ncbi:hypothetical protein TKK_0013281 [Trichogramma kaykai]